MKAPGCCGTPVVSGRRLRNAPPPSSWSPSLRSFISVEQEQPVKLQTQIHYYAQQGWVNAGLITDGGCRGARCHGRSRARAPTRLNISLIRSKSRSEIQLMNIKRRQTLYFPSFNPTAVTGKYYPSYHNRLLRNDSISNHWLFDISSFKSFFYGNKISLLQLEVVVFLGCSLDKPNILKVWHHFLPFSEFLQINWWIIIVGSRTQWPDRKTFLRSDWSHRSSRTFGTTKLN